MTDRDLMNWWGRNFPFDKWWRDKYKIPFNSEAHRNTSPIDIYLEWLEDEIHNEQLNTAIDQRERRDQYSKGIIVRKRKIDKAKEDELFEKLKLNLKNIKVGK